MSEWKEYGLHEIASFSQGKQIPVSEQFENKLLELDRFIRIVDFTSDWTQPPRYVKKDDKYKVGKNDIVMLRYGTPGKVFRGHEGIIANNMFKISPDESIVTKEYLYWFLYQDSVYKILMANQSSSTMPAISFKMLSCINVKVPSFETQQHISSFFDTLDEKIAVNKKICENLEAQAQALFKHWFVDFAPFKDGKFVESELGLIPEGWRVGTLGDIAELRKPSIKPQDNILYTHYSIPAFDNSKKPTVDEGSTIKSNKFGINDGAVLLSKLNPSTKRIWYTGKVPEHSVSSTEFLPFYSKNKEFTPFIYCYLNCDKNYREIANGAKGTTNSHQRIDANSILIRALAYSEEAIRCFCVCTQNLMELILEANQESLRLATLRDTLLPKLMSGQIKINEIEKSL